MSDRYELFLTCPKGLEGLLLEEATGLGLEEAREHTSAIRGMATMETAYRLCLWSRLANRVLLVLKRFPMKDAEDLYHGVLDIEWQDHMVPDGTLAVEDLLVAVDADVADQQHLARLGVVFRVVAVDVGPAEVDLHIVLGHGHAFFEARLAVSPDFHRHIGETAELGTRRQTEK